MPTFNLTKHKELWNWLAENPGSLKVEWPGWDEIEDWDDEMYPNNNCFACEFLQVSLYEEGTENYDLDPETCEKHCPLIWPEGRTCTNGFNSLYREWDNYNSQEDFYAEASVLAKQIAELPVREGVETE